MSAKRKDRPHAPQATVKIPPRGISLPTTPRTIKPRSGKSSTQKLKFNIHLASQHVHIVHIDSAARAEDGDDDSQAHYDLGGSDS